MAKPHGPNERVLNQNSGPPLSIGMPHKRIAYDKPIDSHSHLMELSGMN